MEKQELLPARMNTGNLHSNDYVAMVAAQMEEGNLDLVDVAKLHKMKKALEKLFDNPRFKQFVKDERSKYGKEHPVLMGVEVQMKPTKTTYDFSGCNHPELEAWYNVALLAKGAIDGIEAQLKLMKPEDSKNVLIEKLPFVDFVESGEVAMVNGAVKLQNEGIAFQEK